MALQVKVGSFEQPTATGDLAITGVGFEPAVVLFFWTYFSASNALAAGTGAADADGNEWSFFYAADATGGSAACARTSSGADVILTADSSGLTMRKRASFVSMDADGFTVNYSIANATTGLTCRYLAIGGTGVEGTVGTFSGMGSAGNFSVTGTGFEPECLFIAHNHLASFTSSATAFIGYGVASDPSSQGAWHQADYHGTGNTVVTSWQQTDAVINGYDGGSNDFSGALNSFDADGFTINVTNARVSGNLLFGYVAVRGGLFKVVNETSPTSAIPKATTGVGFTPEWLFTTSYGNPGGVGLVDSLSMHPSFGASDGTTEWSQSGQDQANALSGTSRNYESATKAIGFMADIAVATAAEADVQSFDADGFTLNWTTGNAPARQFFALAMAPQVEVQTILVPHLTVATVA